MLIRWRRERGVNGTSGDEGWIIRQNRRDGYVSGFRRSACTINRFRRTNFPERLSVRYTEPVCRYVRLGLIRVRGRIRSVAD